MIVSRTPTKTPTMMTASPIEAQCRTGQVSHVALVILLSSLYSARMDWKVRLYVRLSWVLFVGGLIGWAATHVLMIVTKPEGATSWWAHVLIGISWLAIVVTALGVIVSADVRREQEED